MMGDTSVTVHTYSPTPVRISVSDGYGSPLRYWQTLGRGHQVSQTVITGRPYGYRFAQATGAGFVATRGCGAMTMHERINGSQAPDGLAVTWTLTNPAQ
jgi:hypothetical protein